MFKRLGRAGRYTITILQALPSTAQRNLLGRMTRLSRDLPHQFDQPLPLMMAGFTPPAPRHPPFQPDTVRCLADAVAAWHFRSPLGICLRRSLLRYYFLREVNLPVRIVFGARLKADSEGSGLGGHAWLTLDDQPYHENPADYEGFVEMYVYPPEDGSQ